MPLEQHAAWRQESGRILSPFEWGSAYVPAASPVDGARVLSMTRYDPGSAAYRYHSAANSVLGGRSAFVRYEDTNPHCSIRQFDGARDAATVLGLFESANIVHAHMDYTAFDDPKFLNRSFRPDQLVIRHYHGSDPRSPGAKPLGFTIFDFERDAAEGALMIGARLYHSRFHPDMQWLPIPVPVRDYERIATENFVPREQRAKKRWRIAHSPTHTRIKGTIVLETVVAELQAKGLDIELVMIAGKPHAEALAMKATCDLTFDSFWLGIQGSGLEAACMGQPVVAGDPAVRAEYEAAIGECPYTYVDGYDSLRETLERLVTDPSFYALEATKVAGYTRRYHDYPAVGERYWSLIRARLARGIQQEAAA